MWISNVRISVEPTISTVLAAGRGVNLLDLPSNFLQEENIKIYNIAESKQPQIG